MLLSTLRSYLLAAGADLELTARWDDGRRAELTLGEATQQGQPSRIQSDNTRPGRVEHGYQRGSLYRCHSATGVSLPL